MTEDILKRVPPQDLFAEQSVLGAVLLENGALDRALEVMTADDLYRESHRGIFLAMLDLAAGKRAIDALTLTDALRSRGKLEAIGGPAYLAELGGCVPTAKNVRHYAAIVHDKAMLRRLGALGHTLIDASYDCAR
jgi:replicative DNA helicase